MFKDQIKTAHTFRHHDMKIFLLHSPNPSLARVSLLTPQP
jgi:hypothetical protein